MTVRTESFNKADADTLGPDQVWTELGGDVFDLVSLAAQTAQLDGDCYARCDADVATVDHYVQAVIDPSNETGPYAGVLGRKDSSATMTYYLGVLWWAENQVYIVKYVATVATVLAGPASVTLTAGTPVTARLEITGSGTTNIRVLTGGVERLNVNDSSSPIITGTRGGLYGFKTTNGNIRYTAFEIGDIAAAGGGYFLSGKQNKLANMGGLNG